MRIHQTPTIWFSASLYRDLTDGLKKHSRKNILVWRKKTLRFSVREVEVVVPRLLCVQKAVPSEISICSHIPVISLGLPSPTLLWCKTDFGGSFKTSLGSFLSSTLVQSCNSLLLREQILSKLLSLSPADSQIMGVFTWLKTVIWGNKASNELPLKIICMKELLKDMQNFPSLRHYKVHSCMKPGYPRDT